MLTLVRVFRGHDHLLRLLNDLVVVAQNVLKHVASNSQCQRRRDVPEELIELVLLLHGKHDSLEIFADILAKDLW